MYNILCTLGEKLNFLTLRIQEMCTEHQEMQRKVHSIGQRISWKFCPILYVSCSRKFHFCSVVYRNTGNRRARADGYQPISIQDDDDGVRVVSSGRRTSRRSEPSLVIALVRSFWPIFLAAAFFKVLQDLLNFVSPQLLK